MVEVVSLAVGSPEGVAVKAGRTGVTLAGQTVVLVARKGGVLAVNMVDTVVAEEVDLWVVVGA